MAQDFEAALSPMAANLLLATRCLGRATPFPHSLMQRFVAALDDTSSYEAVMQELRSRKMIVAKGNIAFDISAAGWDWLGYRQVSFEIWWATMTAVAKTVPASRAANDREVLELMVIHAAALANSIYERDKEIHIRLMGLSVECQIHLGQLDEAKLRLETLKKLADELKKTPKP